MELLSTSRVTLQSWLRQPLILAHTPSLLFLLVVARRAEDIHRRLKQDEKLNDDTIDIVIEGFKRVLVPNSRIRIFYPTFFEIDVKGYPCKLKRLPKVGEPMYAPLHHKSSGHWTLCVLLIKYDFEPSCEPSCEINFEINSEINSIRLEFYDTLVDLSRPEKVKAFFTKWIKTFYPNFKLTFDQKETAQQNDETNCGVFVLETIRRLIASEDVARTIEPRDANNCFLDMLTSIDTNSPFPPPNLQVIGAIKALERKGDTSAIMDGSLSTTQQPTSIQPSERIITQIRSLLKSEETSIAEQLSRAAEETERLKLELEATQNELDTAKRRVEELTNQAEELKTLKTKQEGVALIYRGLLHLEQNGSGGG